MNNNESSLWGGAEVISAYGREEAIADGVLVDVSPMAREAGFTVSFRQRCVTVQCRRE